VLSHQGLIFKAPYYKVEGKDRIIVHRVAQIAVDNSATVVIGVISIKTKKAIKISVMISVGYFR
jgi:hypothetical protein